LPTAKAGAPSIKAGTSAHRAFTAALEEVCRSLALQIVADGEGAQRVIEIEVRNAKTEAAAKRIAETIATSPLVKTAFAGGDPNWGRIFAAAGRSGVKFDTALVDIRCPASRYCGAASRSISMNAPRATNSSPNTFR